MHQQPHFRFDCSGCRELARELSKARKSKNWNEVNELEVKRRGHIRSVQPDLELSKQKVIRLYREGASLRDLGKRFGTTPEAMSDLFREWGEATRRGGPGRERMQYSSDTKAKMISDYLSGVSVEVIGQRYGGSPPTVRKNLREWGIALRTRSEAGMARRQRKP